MGIVIIGGGMAAGNAAATLREEGYDGELIILGDEPTLPFGRPPLSKGYLRGEEDVEGWYVRPPEWYEENAVQLRRDARVASVDPRSKSVTTAAGEKVTYDQLLIATGGRNRTIQAPGAQLEGVLQLRRQADSDRIREVGKAGGSVAIVGGSFIGTEVAASLTQLGAQVSMFFPEEAPLARVLGPAVGGAIQRIHEAKGVQVKAGEMLEAFEGVGRVNAVRTESGFRVECVAAIAALGIVPNVEFLEGSGIETQNGVLVDELGRTNVPQVFACGDVANMQHPLFGRLRVEHFNNAEKHGRAVALSMLGRGKPYDYNFSFWSDQYEHSLEYIGFASKWDEVVIRGSLEEARFLAFYLQDEQLLAAAGLNRGGDPELEAESELAACAALIRNRAQVNSAALADEGIDLHSLVS